MWRARAGRGIKLNTGGATPEELAAHTVHVSTGFGGRVSIKGALQEAMAFQEKRAEYQSQHGMVKVLVRGGVVLPKPEYVKPNFNSESLGLYTNLSPKTRRAREFERRKLEVQT